MAGFSEFVPGGDTHHLVALREDCDSRAAAPEAQFAFDVAVSWKYGNGRFSQTGTLAQDFSKHFLPSSCAQGSCCFAFNVFWEMPAYPVAGVCRGGARLNSSAAAD